MLTQVSQRTGRQLVNGSKQSQGERNPANRRPLLPTAARTRYYGARDVFSDPSDVNHVQDHLASRRHAHHARLVAAGAASEQRCLARLSPSQRQKYVAVRACLRNAGRAGDTPAQLALQQLLVNGRLPGGRTGPDGGTLLDQLARIAMGKVGQHLDRNTLLADMVQELRSPSAINQQRNNTCGATTASIHLARHRPAEYARLVADLALGGKAKLADGSTWRREDAGPAARRGRSQSQHLLQAVFTEIGNGSRDYRDRNDSHALFGVPLGDWADGLAPGGLCHVLDRVYARNFHAVGNLITGAPSNAVSALQARTQRGETPPAVIHMGGANLHWVMVTAVKREAGRLFVHYTNPWGQNERMAATDFKAILRSYVADSRR